LSLEGGIDVIFVPICSS